MSALSGHGAAHRLRTHLAAAVAATTVVGVAVVGTAVPAQARPRSCANIAQSIAFFEQALADDYGPNARFYAQDAYYWGVNVRLYYASGC